MSLKCSVVGSLLQIVDVEMIIFIFFRKGRLGKGLSCGEGGGPGQRGGRGKWGDAFNFAMCLVMPCKHGYFTLIKFMIFFTKHFVVGVQM